MPPKHLGKLFYFRGFPFKTNHFQCVFHENLSVTRPPPLYMTTMLCGMGGGGQDRSGSFQPEAVALGYAF
jgi:hypothetical protein